LTPENAKAWARAIEAFKRDGNLRKVLAKVDMSPEHQTQLTNEADAEKVPENAVA
jgi:hypothetical protein